MSEALLILNGKKANQPDVRLAVNTLRDTEHQLDVRVTWEAGDIGRYIDEACVRNLERVVVGGGDGSVNEAANAILTREGKIPVNLDGESYAANQIRFSVQPGAIKVVLPQDCPCIQ